ncbi:MAG: type II toxin-antitoxin system RelB/DinJ family antitoxin [Clostridia bacterium]|nr:type II toxin-antitoxin system RelB/DinJ family antitoxin [Clostridia bacterium]
MARTSNVFARVEPEVKEQAETILNQLGIPMSNAVSMFLNQVVIQRGIPFEMKLPSNIPLSYGSLSKEQFDAEIGKSMQSVKEGRGYSAEDIATEMRKDYGV